MIPGSLSIFRGFLTSGQSSWEGEEDGSATDLDAGAWLCHGDGAKSWVCFWEGKAEDSESELTVRAGDNSWMGKDGTGSSHMVALRRLGGFYESLAQSPLATEQRKKHQTSL